jgi:hypothetical protein
MRAVPAFAILSLVAGGSAPAAPAPRPVPVPAPASAACTPTVQAAPDRNGLYMPPERTARMVAQTRDHFVAAARAACAAGVIAPRDLAHFGHLLLREADGTTEPMLFTREAGPNTALLDYAYQGGPAPTVAALRTALRCWKHPGGRDCDPGD